MVRACVEAFGKVDVLVNNVGHAKKTGMGEEAQ
jgi:NADP-dependent 3-hydroxy acid dehydrogenase YdfG